VLVNLLRIKIECVPEWRVDVDCPLAWIAYKQTHLSDRRKWRWSWALLWGSRAT